ncbi:MAG: hypothetical protein PHY16_00585 [Methylobacter sp.]|nr:hypothetical protein [Methylobacter sp.]
MRKEKDENLEMLRGAGGIYRGRSSEQALTIETLRSGAEFHLKPGMEHCLILIKNLLVIERSSDPKNRS